MTDKSIQNRFAWFRELKKPESHAILNAFDLLVEIGMGRVEREEIKIATMQYVRACLGRPGDLRSEDSRWARDVLRCLLRIGVNRIPYGTREYCLWIV